MTQMAGPESVLGDFDGLTLYFDGRPYRLSSGRGRYFVELFDPDAVDSVLDVVRSGDIERAQAGAAAMPRVVREIVMTTGSHHYQLYWYPTGRNRELYMLPFAWMIEERRWLPRVSVFLTPPNQLEPRKVWNRDCLPCHSTRGSPGYEPGGAGTPDSKLAEAGIACEACHGPGLSHAAANSDPLRRYLLHHFREGDPTIVQPERLRAARSAQVCGQCHSLSTQYVYEDWAATLRDGMPYRPGEDLSDTTYVVLPRTLDLSPLMKSFVRERPEVLDEWFWPGGEIRVVGREFNGLLESPCYQGEAFSCLSCHAAHESDPNDQLRSDVTEDGMCLQCHDRFSRDVESHTRHEPDSEGSRCQNCHMPRTTYGLLKASRSHRVTVPSVADELETQRPNACNLCHLDRTLEWTAEQLRDSYGHRMPSLGRDHRETPAGALWALQGDAGLRAIAAWHFGTDAAWQASGDDWLAPVLAPLLNDPYDAVRYIALRALRALPGFATFDSDFLDPPDSRRAAVSAVWDRWLNRNARPDPSRFPGLFDRAGAPRTDVIARLYSGKDERPVYLVE